MKEVILESKRFPSLQVQLLDGNIALLHDRSDANFSADSDVYIYEVYKLLRAADHRGAFKKVSTDEEVHDCDSETILI